MATARVVVVVVVIEGNFGFVVGERKEPKPKRKRRRSLRGVIEEGETESVVATVKVAIFSEDKRRR